MEKINFRRFLPVFIIITIALSIYFTNLFGNFWLSGWDNLHPEFDFFLNIKRAVFSSWQEYQGLGLPAGHAHASEFFREILLTMLSFFTTLQGIRKIYVLLMLCFGPLGVFFLLKNYLFNQKGSENFNISALFGALFYMLHIAAIQIFYLPYEAFLTHYGIMPWMIYSVYQYLHRPNKKSALLLIFIHLLGASQFYIPTISLVYGFILLVISLSFIKKAGVNKLLNLILILTITNLFWLLPFLYYLYNNIGSQLNSYTNLLYSYDIYLKNLSFGGFLDAILLKGFLFNFTDQISTHNYGYLMGIWREYLSNPLLIIFGLFLFIITVSGVISGLRKKIFLPYIVLFLVFFAFIAIDTPIFKEINLILRKSALFDQIFRNPFTKFANSLLFVESVFFASGMQQLLGFLKKQNKNLVYGFAGTVFIIQISLIVPVWKNYFIYPNLKVEIPNDYFDLFEYFKTKGDERIANFPQYSPNGWGFYNWGSRGSGFLWYGIKQPILDRAFDVWDKNSENYFWEIYKAIYSNDPVQTITILKKYAVRWVVVDNNIASGQIINQEKFRNLLNQIPDLKRTANFGNIEVYEVVNTQENNFISLYNNLPDIGPKYSWGDYDNAYSNYGTYYTDIQNNTDSITYPFRSLFTRTALPDNNINIDQTKDAYIFSSNVLLRKGSVLIIPKLYPQDITRYDKTDLSKSFYNFPQIYLDEERIDFSEKNLNEETRIILTKDIDNLKVIIPKLPHYYSFDSQIDKDWMSQPLKSCDKYQTGKYSKKIVSSGLEMSSTGSSNCFDINLPVLSQKYGYLIGIENQNIRGRGIFFSLYNNTYNSNELQTYLNNIQGVEKNYLIVPPKDQYGLGYNLHFDNYSLSKETSINILKDIRVDIVPYLLLTNIKSVSEGDISSTNITSNIQVEHPNTSVYTVSINHPELLDNPTVVLNQSYNRGWLAFSNSKLLKHVLVNNWANGWRLDNKICNAEDVTCNVYIIFWPQYLEYAGFGLLILLVFYYIYRR